MEKSTLFDVFDGALFYKWREEIEKTEINKTLRTDADQLREQPDSALNSQEKELLKSYSFALENALDYIYYTLNVRILNLGIKIGLELGQNSAQYDGV